MTRIQNRLEEWWIRVDDYRAGAVLRHTTFMVRIARLTTKALDTLFGSRLLTFRAAWTLGFSAFASVFFVAGLGFISDPPATAELFSVLFAFFVNGALLLGLALLPLTVSQETSFKWGCLILLALCSLPILLLCVGYLIEGSPIVELLKPLLVFCAFIASIALCYGVSVLFYRWAIWKCAKSTSLFKSLLIILGVCLFAVAILKVPIELAKVSPANDKAFKAIASANLAATFPLVLFIALAGLVPIHRILWEFVDKPLYAAQRFEIVRNRKIWLSLGIFLITVSGVPFLGKVVNTVMRVLSGR